MSAPTLLTFGHGYVAQALARRLGGRVVATAREASKRDALSRDGLRSIDPADAAAVEAALAEVDAVLVSAAPDEAGCPGFRALGPLLRGRAGRPGWIGYLSSTSVYGDLEGRWAFEASALMGKSIHAARRTAAEQEWLQLGACVFRLGAIYGPGRSALERVTAGESAVTHKPGQVFSRAHVDDIADLLEASLARPRAGAIYNVVDDEPSSAESVMDEAARLLGAPPARRVPFGEAELSEEARRFWAECRRVSNALAKAELGWRPAYPTFREGLAAIGRPFKEGSGGRVL